MIDQIQKQNCSGCYACYSACPKHCITMQSDSEGFWYPQVNQANCANCGLCEKICPILHRTAINNKPQTNAAYHKDEKVRMNSSSGGVFTALAEEILNRGGLVFGAGFDEKFQVIHSYAETKQELEKFRGSKYVQSKIGNTFIQAKDFLESGRLVYFSGTPCQIGGLKLYLGIEYDNLICQDFICHGVPSPKVWQKYIEFREAEADSQARRIAFRRKDEGWKRFSVAFEFGNDTEYRETHDRDLYMQAFLHNVCLRPSCYHCAFKTLHRTSDITLADFWGVEQVLPKMFDDKGTSLIFINSTKGEKLFHSVSESFITKPVDLQSAVAFNSAAFESVAVHPKRHAFFESLDKLTFDQLVWKYETALISTALKKKVKYHIKKALKAIGLFDATKKLLQHTYTFRK